MLLSVMPGRSEILPHSLAYTACTKTVCTDAVMNITANVDGKLSPMFDHRMAGIYVLFPSHILCVVLLLMFFLFIISGIEAQACNCTHR